MDNKANNPQKPNKAKQFDLSINDHSLKLLITYFSVISALELLAYGVGGFFSVLATYIWLFTGIFWVGYFLSNVGLTIVNDIKKKKFVLLGVFSFLILFLFIFIGNISFSDINPDATQQLAAGLKSFDFADLNYTGIAFLGYPNRQYVIAAIPALIFGRSIWTAHAGFGIMFLIGLTVLFINLRAWLKKNSLKEEYALLPCFAFLAFPFITEYYMNFEQAITPVALTMLGIGLFLKLTMEPDILSIMAVSYVGCLMADSYTPVLASMGLLLVFVCIYAFKLRRSPRDNQKQTEIEGPAKKRFVPISYACFGCAANILAFFIATYISGRSDRLTEFRENTSLVKTALTTWKDFFTDANVRFLGLFAGAVILYMLLSVTLRLKIADLLVSLWVLGVVFFSDYMTGYTAYDKAWLMQRNMVVIPVLVVCIFIAIINFLKKHELTISQPIQVILIIFFFATGLFNFMQPHRSFKYFGFIQPMKYAIDYIDETLKENGLKNTDKFNLIIYTDNVLQSNIHDYAAFFYPNATTYSESGYLYNSSLDYSKPSIYLAEDTRLKTLEPDNAGADTYIKFLKSATGSKTYKNIRYGTEITWHMKYISP